MPPISRKVTLTALMSHWRAPLPWLVFILCLGATAWCWIDVRSSLDQSARIRFELRSQLITSLISRGFIEYRQAMQAAAVFAETTRIDQLTWQTYVHRLRLDEMLPGLQMLAYATAEGGKMQIVAVAPASDTNQMLIGTPVPPPLDATAARRPSSSDVLLEVLPFRISTRDNASSNTLRLAMPMSSGQAMPPAGDSEDSEPKSLPSSYILATANFDALVAGTAASLLQDLNLQVRDETAATPRILFDSEYGSQYGEPREAVHWHTEIPVKLGGRQLSFRYEATDNFGPVREENKAIWVLIGGSTLSLLLLGSLLALGRAYSSANLVAQRMGADLRHNESRLFSIIQSAMEAVITVDEHQNIVIFNPMAERIFRCSAMEAIGAPLGRFIPERFRDAHAKHVVRFGQTGISERQMGQGRPLWGLRADGEEFPVEASISQTRDGGGKLYTVLLRDVTERQQTEQALKASRNELAQLSARLQTIREEEKTHIARELHDDLGQRLTSLKMDLSLLERALPADAAAARERTKGMHGLIDATVSAVRRIAADLRPVMLDDLGLGPAIEWLASDFSSRYGIQTTVNIENELGELDNNTATALFRTIQEALNNVARHAQASHVNIVMRREAGSWRVCVDDNGQGVAPEQMSKPKSFGLIGIRERVRLLNGHFHVRSKPAEGFHLEITVPAPPNTHGSA